MEIVCLMLAKKEIGLEDWLIVEKAMNLWVALVLQRDELVDEFYEYKRSEDKANRYGSIKNAHEFVI